MGGGACRAPPLLPPRTAALQSAAGCRMDGASEPSRAPRSLCRTAGRSASRAPSCRASCPSRCPPPALSSRLRQPLPAVSPRRFPSHGSNPRPLSPPRAAPDVRRLHPHDRVLQNLRPRRRHRRAGADQGQRRGGAVPPRTSAHPATPPTAPLPAWSLPPCAQQQQLFPRARCVRASGARLRRAHGRRDVPPAAGLGLPWAAHVLAQPGSPGRPVRSQSAASQARSARSA